MAETLSIAEICKQSRRSTVEHRLAEEGDRRLALSKIAAQLAAGAECGLDDFIFLVTAGQYATNYPETTERLGRLKFATPSRVVGIFKDRTMNKNPSFSLPLEQKTLQCIGITNEDPVVSFVAAQRTTSLLGAAGSLHSDYSLNARLHLSSGRRPVSQRSGASASAALVEDELIVPLIDRNWTSFKSGTMQRQPTGELAVASVAFGIDAIYKELEDVDDRDRQTVSEFIDATLGQ